MFETGEPVTGAECRAAMQRLADEGHSFLDALAPGVFHAAQGDRWSPAEHIRHLRKTTAPVARALRIPKLILRWKFGRGAGSSRSYAVLLQQYREALAAGGKAGPFTPSPEAAPADATGRRAEILASWRGAVDELDAAGRRWNEAALDRYQLPHPLLGKLTIREMLMFTVFHTGHHLASIRNRAERNG